MFITRVRTYSHNDAKNLSIMEMYVQQILTGETNETNNKINVLEKKSYRQISYNIPWHNLQFIIK